MNRDKLTANMADQIKEAQLKLGYVEETVRLYYPLSSLCVLLEEENRMAGEKIGREKSDRANINGEIVDGEKIAEENRDDEIAARGIIDGEEILTALRESFDGWKDCPLGKVSFALHSSRLEVSIPPEGVKYVHEQVENPAFLSALINLFRENHHCGIKAVCQVFEDFSEDYVCEKLSRETAERMGFDYVLYFRDKAVDAYYYCIKEEMGHTIYHRFTKEDYEIL